MDDLHGRFIRSFYIHNFALIIIENEICKISHVYCSGFMWLEYYFNFYWILSWKCRLWILV